MWELSDWGNEAKGENVLQSKLFSKCINKNESVCIHFPFFLLKKLLEIEFPVWQVSSFTGIVAGRESMVHGNAKHERSRACLVIEKENEGQDSLWHLGLCFKCMGGPSFYTAKHVRFYKVKKKSERLSTAGLTWPIWGIIQQTEGKKLQCFCSGACGCAC